MYLHKRNLYTGSNISVKDGCGARAYGFIIQKKRCQYINKLRFVQLHEADFNTLLNILLGRQLMKHGDAHGLNGHQLYGSRKGKFTYDALITVCIIYNMA